MFSTQESFLHDYQPLDFFTYCTLLEEGEPVVVTERPHGEQVRCVFRNGQFQFLTVLFHKVPCGEALQELCRGNPNLVVHAVLVEDSLSVHDISGPDGWLSFREAHRLAGKYSLDWVRVLSQRDEFIETEDMVCEVTCYAIPYELSRMKKIAEGHDIMIRPLFERQDERLGRVCFQLKGTKPR